MVPGNLVWCMRKLQLDAKYSTTYQTALTARNMMFLVLRPLLAPVCLYYAYRQCYQGDFESTMKVLWEQIQKLPLPITLGTAFNVGVLGTLNLVWTAMMLTSMVRRRRKLTPKKED